MSEKGDDSLGCRALVSLLSNVRAPSECVRAYQPVLLRQPQAARKLLTPGANQLLRGRLAGALRISSNSVTQL